MKVRSHLVIVPSDVARAYALTDIDEHANVDSDDGRQVTEEHEGDGGTQSFRRRIRHKHEHHVSI